MPTPLTDVERDILVFARLTWRYEGHRETAILERFGMTKQAYDLKLVRLIRTEAALAFDPVNVNRLRRLRDSRQRSRSVRR